MREPHMPTRRRNLGRPILETKKGPFYIRMSKQQVLFALKSKKKTVGISLIYPGVTEIKQVILDNTRITKKV